MEPSATRQQMEKFLGLKACLRKPCPFRSNCRNLHISLGKQKENINILKSNNLDSRRRVFEMLGPTASWGANSTEVDGTTSTQERGLTNKEGQHAGEKEEAVTFTKSGQGVPQKELKEDKNQNQVELRRAKSSKSGDGEAADEKEEEIEGEEEEIGPPPPQFYKPVNNLEINNTTLHDSQFTNKVETNEYSTDNQHTAVNNTSGGESVVHDTARHKRSSLGEQLLVFSYN
jgi:hypothetical protein